VTYNNSSSWIRFAVTASGRWFQTAIPPGAMTTFEWK